MSFNRVQKLLFSEYCDFEDMVLIESPFAQTTRDGRGIRQVHLGLTPSKLVLATDVLPPAECVDVRYDPDVDPDIETFELIAIYPVECVNLSVYRKRRKQALKARFCNNKVLYFELGGFERRAMFWNLWCEKVKFLCPGHSSSSKSETSVATSSTGSTMYLVDKRFVRINSKSQVWCRFGATALIGGGENGTAHEKLIGKWTDKHLYLGKSFEGVFNLQPKLEQITEETFVVPKSGTKVHESKQQLCTSMEEEGLNFGDIVKVNRFGLGISEGCGNPLFLSVDDYLIPKRYSTLMQEIKAIRPNEDPTLNIYQLLETAVLEWELYNADDPNKYKIKHRRRYGLTTCPLMLYGFHPLFPLRGPRYLLQLKRAVSEVSIRKTPKETELTLPVDKRLLRSSLSLQYLNSYRDSQPSDIFRAPKRPAEFFWTTGYTYQPKTSKESYDELRKQLKKLKQLHSGKVKRKRKKRPKKIFKKNAANQTKTKDSEDDSADDYLRKKIRKKKHGFIYTMFSNKLGTVPEAHAGSTLECLKMALHSELSVTAWDLDSTKLAEQLTMIDRDLFLKIPTSELEVLIQQKSSENAPNICTLLAFSHRISCLLATEVLKNDSEKSRARLIARFINAANKCHRVSNFQTCKTIISSLQSPGVYRLRNTWAYLRKKHASKYQCFEILCRLYRDCRLPTYQKTFYLLSQNPPFLPHISDVISRLLGKVPGYVLQPFSISRLPSVETTKSVSTIVSMEDPSKPVSIIARIIRVFKGGGGDALARRRESRKRSRSKPPLDRRPMKYKTLCEYYRDFDYNPSERFEDLEEAQKFLEKCQLGAMDYNFKIDESARDYLLKARYGEEKKNFYKSFSLEPSRTYYKSKSE